LGHLNEDTAACAGPTPVAVRAYDQRQTMTDVTNIGDGYYHGR
jgi:hypothetical protein